MTTFETAEVVEILMERDGLQRMTVRMLDDHGDMVIERAYCLTRLIGAVEVGDEVVCNTTAVRMGLGTGGHHVVHWNLSRRSFSEPGPDHIMKLRYTSLQLDAGTSELRYPDTPHALSGTPVVAFSVHSQLGIMAATLRSEAPHLTAAYVMTDGAALPLVLSDLVDDLAGRGLLAATITAGHAFGGDLEAVTVASGMALAANVVKADVILVGMGPGVVGTGTSLGTTAIEAASILDTAFALGGRPVLCARTSSGDGRTRHTGVSHHTDTILDLVARPPYCAPFPEQFQTDDRVSSVPIEVPSIEAVIAALDASDVSVTTMGRGPREDESFFRSAACAARVAASLVDAA